MLSQCFSKDTKMVHWYVTFYIHLLLQKDILSAVQLTVDHIASSHSEQELIAQRGGSVSRSGGIERVNGILAVSRSLGDISLAPFLSRSPHVLALTKTEVRGMCGAAADQDKPCFLIAASDGLW